MSRTKRHLVLRQLLDQQPATSQEALVAGLKGAGIQVTQATVSRDLAAIGAVRGPSGYRLAGPNEVIETNPSQGDRLNTMYQDHVISATAAASIVVLHTAPGHANFVASEIDSIRPKGIVGCLAGDDTIFIATPSNKEASAMAQNIQTITGGEQ